MCQNGEAELIRATAVKERRFTIAPSPILYSTDNWRTAAKEPSEGVSVENY